MTPVTVLGTVLAAPLPTRRFRSGFRFRLGFRVAAAALAVAVVALSPAPSHAQDPSPGEPAVQERKGFAVIAIARSGDSAWPLAQAVYRSSLRPASVDEPRARVLAGEAPREGSATALVELADTRDAITGTDAPSRRLLRSIVSSLDLEGIIVLRIEEGVPVARVLYAGSDELDAAVYKLDPDAGWAPLVRSLERGRRAPAGAFTSAPPIVRSEKKDEGKHFYSSAWFWGAIGAAVVAGGAIYFVTRDSDPGSIKVTMKVPR